MSLLRLFLPRQIILAALLAAAVGIPYFSTDGNWRQWIDWAKSKFQSNGDDVSIGSDWLASLGITEESNDSEIMSDGNATGANTAGQPKVTPTMSLKDLPTDLSGPENARLQDLIRFDRSPYWVTQNWSRVTTVLAEVELEGFRVPVVTGTELTDFAGSITYYFDKQHQLQRIVLDGMCGETGLIEEFAAEHLGLKRQPTLGAALYTASWNGRHRSVLKCDHAPVVESRSPFTRYTVYMELNHPSSPFGISPEGNAMLKRDRQSWRW